MTWRGYIMAVRFQFIAAFVLAFSTGRGAVAEDAQTRDYANELTVIENPPPLLGDYPEFVQPVEEERRYEAPILIDEEAGDLSVRAWRFSYNARGIIEIPNRIEASYTAVIFVHPWGIDD